MRNIETSYQMVFAAETSHCTIRQQSLSPVPRARSDRRGSQVDLLTTLRVNRPPCYRSPEHRTQELRETRYQTPPVTRHDVCVGEAVVRYFLVFRNFAGKND